MAKKGGLLGDLGLGFLTGHSGHLGGRALFGLGETWIRHNPKVIQALDAAGHLVPGPWTTYLDAASGYSKGGLKGAAVALAASKIGEGVGKYAGNFGAAEGEQLGGETGSKIGSTLGHGLGMAAGQGSGMILSHALGLGNSPPPAPITTITGKSGAAPTGPGSAAPAGLGVTGSSAPNNYPWRGGPASVPQEQQQGVNGG